MIVRGEITSHQIEPITFSLVHGAYHDSWVWLYVQQSLARAGYDSIAPSLPIEDPEATFDDYAQVVADAEAASGAERIVRVGWSRAGNVIPRAVGRTAVEKLIFIAPGFHPSTLDLASEDEPARYSLTFGAGIYEGEHNLTSILLEPEMIRYAFYNDVRNDMLAGLAIGQLRQQRKAAYEPPLSVFPDLPMEDIICRKDHIIRPDWQLYVANRLGIEPRYINTGHSPMLSRPKLLTRKLIELANAPPQFRS